MKKYRQYLRPYIPNSAKADEHPLLTYQNLYRFPFALNELGQYSQIPIEETSAFAFNTENQLEKVLSEKFRYYKSDKVQHALHLVYGQILTILGINEALHLLEIGIGSKNEAIVSHMPHYTNPGSSLRAFRDVLPNAKIYGADIDSEVLFSEDRIQTAFVDQMDPNTFQQMQEEFGAPQYDLIIDDGLHSVSANLNTLLFGLSHLKKGGWIVIEDIANHRICFNTIYRLLADELYEKYIIKGRFDYIFALKKL